MRYQLKQIHCRPWLLNGLSLRLIESHYENNYGGALRRLNAINEELASLDFTTVPAWRINGLKREELVALNSTLLHELYFASLGGDGKPAGAAADAKRVDGRYEDAVKVEPPRPLVQEEFADVPVISVEEVKAMLDGGKDVQFIDARPAHYASRTQDIVEGATWRDPDRVHEWMRDLPRSGPVVVYCAYGYHVGCRTAAALREAGFDAKYMSSGHSGWKAIGGAVRLRP